MATNPQREELDIYEQVAKIRQLIADSDRKRQEIRFAPLTLMLTGLGSGAALFAAAVAFTKAVWG